MSDLDNRALDERWPNAKHIAPDGYPICPACDHHVSAYSGSCTKISPVFHDENFSLEYCGCDCMVALGGLSLQQKVAGWFKND